jgi:hypothetical protein
VLPEALLQRMQAVVRAAHAQAAEENEAADEHRREQPVIQGQAAAKPSQSLPQRARAKSNGRMLPPGTVPSMRPPSSPAGWSIADDDTSPLPRLTASGEIATTDVDDRAAVPGSTAPPNGAQPNGAATPGHVLRRERAVKRDRHAARRERAARQEQERAAREQRERAARLERERTAEREHAAQQERQRTAQQERERRLAAERERERAAEQERQRTADLERERAAQQERRRLAAAAQARADLLEHPRPRAPKAATRRRYSPATVIAAALVVVAGGSLAAVMFSNGPKRTGPSIAAAAPAQVAAWVANQVSPTAAVACDPAMCRTLSAKGVNKLVILGQTATDVLRSQVVVATAAVRHELGARLGLVYAPAVIASFGSGDARIDIRVVAPDGPVAFQAALATDLENRKQAGELLLSNPRVAASGQARREMLAGLVTAQLLEDFVTLATYHPIDILAFGDSAPGASAGIPLRSAELSESGGAAAVQQWLSFLRAQRYPLVPALTKTIRVDGAPVLLIEFAAPSPLGLFATN